MIHGSQRMNADLPATVAAAAVPAAAAVAAVPAPVATAAPARFAASVAAPPRLPRKAAGLAKPSAPVMRPSSAFARNEPWLPSSDASPPASSFFSPTYFLRNAKIIGTTRAIRFVADEVLRPAADESELTSGPALSPNSAGTSVSDPSLSSDCTEALPPPRRPATLPSRFASRPELPSCASRPDAPCTVAPFCATMPMTAGRRPRMADCVALSDSPRNCPARREKSVPSACCARASRLSLMKIPSWARPPSGAREWLGAPDRGGADAQEHVSPSWPWASAPTRRRSTPRRRPPWSCRAPARQPATRRPRGPLASDRGR